MKEIFQHAYVTPICISCLVFAFPAVIHLVQSAIGWQKEAVDQQGRHHRKNQLRNDDLPDRKSTRLNSSHLDGSRMPSSAWKKFFFNDTATTEIYTLSLHDALPI